MENNQQKFTGATFILIRPNGEMLLQLRDEKSKYYPNTWCFPGEGAEVDESPIQNVIRGVQEEYGMKLDETVCQFLTVNHLPQISQEVGVFLCKIKENQTPLLREGKEMRWMKLEEIKKLQLGFEQNKLLPLVEEGLRNLVR